MGNTVLHLAARPKMHRSIREKEKAFNNNVIIFTLGTDIAITNLTCSTYAKTPELVCQSFMLE